MAIEFDGKGSCWIEDVKYPAVGFGTWPLTGEVCFKATLEAGASGYRIIDTATFYGNFKEIGKALKMMGREKFYVISKVWPTSQTPEGIRKDIAMTLDQLQTSYLDAYLLHWPNSKIPITDTLNAMDHLKNTGLIRHIGLSNVTVNHLKRALELNIPIAWVQVEMHPCFYDAELLKFCQKNSIAVQSWAPLGRGRLSEDTILQEFGKKYGKSAAQIALRWVIQHQCIALPGSSNKDHIRQNIDIGDFTLSQEDMDQIDNRAKSGERERYLNVPGLGFSDEFDFSYAECWPKKSEVHS